MYYVYALLDPRRPGPFKYGNWKFDFEPFYIGKGKDNRAFKHLDHTLGNCGNLHKIRKIAKIRRETNEEPVVLIKRKGLSETEALMLETKLIALIGRADKKLGPLTNLTDGGEGTSNREYSRTTRQKISKANREYQKTRPESEREKVRQRMRKTPAEYKAEFFEAWPNVIVKTPYVDVYTVLEFRCKTCKYKWSGKPCYAKAKGCPNCRKNDPAKREAEQKRRSNAASAVHASRSKRAKTAIAEKIRSAQTEAWTSGKHKALHYSKSQRQEIRKKRSEALSAYCKANPEKKRQAAIKGHVTRKRL